MARAPAQMEGTFIPEAVLQQSPQEIMGQLRGIVPNLTYETDKIDSRIIHIKDKRLLQLKTYAIDQEIAPFEFQGPLFQLVEAIAKNGVQITPHALVSAN